ncbi:hypothetical protein J5J86_19065 [Aquabacter sp. L1I39]|uniref:hypothetical protein n=1 Tax=Aquabacter sp. L1I39 TaxID=2820278 RepID=UPI001ADAF86E|nr:hypothetical protein [Aquabacter sp. L1I39]QTL02848.1 hypothetical protein J5J86_19065 [Aquabacter sp. L1I39]
MLDFRNPYCAECVRALNAAVMRNQSEAHKERKALLAGSEIAVGKGSLIHLRTIVNWKSPRVTRHLEKNTDDDISSALAIAVGDCNVDRKISALSELHGVSTAVSSAILTCIDPEKYTVIDVRILDALGVRNPDFKAVYPSYLSYCLKEARRLGVTLRELDRALWKAGDPSWRDAKAIDDVSPS